MTSGPTAELEFVLERSGRRAVAMLEGALEPFGLKPRHYWVMLFLDEQPAQSQQAVAERLSIDPTTMTALVDDLERLQLARRTRHRADRRAHVVDLTPRGRALLRRARAGVASTRRRFVLSLSAGEVAELARLVRTAGRADPAGDGSTMSGG